MSSATMSFAIVDTLAFSKRMQKVGLQKEIAEELAEALKDTQNQSLESAATKQDLQLLEQRIIIKLGTFVIVSAVAVAGFLAWFLPLVIATKFPH